MIKTRAWPIWLRPFRKTPTAVAVYLKTGWPEFDAGLDDMRKELKEAAQAFFLQRRSALRDAAFALNRISTQGTQAVRLRLEQLRGALRHGRQQAIRRWEDRTAALQAQLRQSARFAFSDANFRLDNLSAMLRHRSREYVASRTKALSLLATWRLRAIGPDSRHGVCRRAQRRNIVTDPVGLQAGDSVDRDETPDDRSRNQKSNRWKNRKLHMRRRSPKWSRSSSGLTMSEMNVDELGAQVKTGRRADPVVRNGCEKPKRGRRGPERGGIAR